MDSLRFYRANTNKGEAVEALLKEHRENSNPFDCLCEGALKEVFSSVLASLTPMEERVLREFYGIGCEAKTLKAIDGEISGVNASASAIKLKALRKLKHPSRSRRLRSFMDDEQPALPLSARTHHIEHQEWRTQQRLEADWAQDKPIIDDMAERISRIPNGDYAPAKVGVKPTTYVCP